LGPAFPRRVDLGTHTVRIESEEADAFARALLVDGDEQVGLIEAVPATLPVRWLARQQLREYLKQVCDSRSLVLQRHEFDYKRPLRTDCEYTLQIDCLEQPGVVPTIAIRGVVVDQIHRSALVMQSTIRVVESFHSRPKTNAARAVTLQDGLSQFQVGPIGQGWISRYAVASLDSNPIHCDPQFARAQGLRNTVVHGTMLSGFFARAVQHWFPSAPLTRLVATFLRPVFEGESVRIGGRIVAQGQSSLGRVLRLQLQLDDGSLAAIAEASIG
jgi:acyl dehydratase